jgi:hypothetical protein
LIKPTFHEYKRILGGDQWYYCFENRYGASVIRFPGTDGYEEGLKELAVIEFDDNGDYIILNNTLIIKDNIVKGYLTEEMLQEYLERIKALEPNSIKGD